MLRTVYMNHALKLSIIKKGTIFKFELNQNERKQVNSVLSQLGHAIFELINIPTAMLEKAKFSAFISHQIFDIYRRKLPEALKHALKRAHVETDFVWNFLIGIRTGK